MTGLSWAIADDVDLVHSLLQASDAHQAARTGTPVPQRRREQTAVLVRAGAVHVLTSGSTTLAMFTITGEPPFDLDTAGYNPSASALYLQRLAVHPAHAAEAPMAGAAGVRRAIEIARGRGVDELRCEANPDLTDTRELLDRLGFRQHGPVHGDPNGRHWVYLHKDLRPAG